MLNRQYYADTATMKKTKSPRIVKPTLARSVTEAVTEYFSAMDDQPVSDLYEMVLSEMEAPLLACVLNHTDNNQSQTAAILGLNRGTLRKKLKKYGML